MTSARAGNQTQRAALGSARHASIARVTMMNSRRFPVLALWLVMAVTALVTTGCQHGPATVQAELGEARRLASSARVQFNKAADGTNRAVMAETDEASIAFARESEQSSSLVEHDVAALGPLLRGLGITSEVAILERFQKQFLEYRGVDREILALAVENTNLKAQRLSFGPAKDAADRFKAALTQLPASLTATNRCRAEALVAEAVVSVREMQTLQGPHIASADAAAMTALEQEIARLEAKTSAALSGLRGLVEPSSLAAAQGAFDQFKGVAAQIVALSRRNTNVRSLDLSLRVKPQLAAACDDSLRELESALNAEGSKATR